MRIRLFFISCFLSWWSYGFGQQQLEISLVTRYEQQAEYTSRFFNRYFTNDLTLSGLSQGIGVHYIRPVIKDVKFSLGIGLYQLGILKVRSIGRWGASDRRIIDYTHPIGI